MGLIVLCIQMPVPTASGWANGRSGPNGYGTHDWILDKALAAVERRNNSVGWVRRDVALWATDNPDTVDGIDHASGTWWHVYDIWGETYGGAPEAVEIWYCRASQSLRTGDRKQASRALGYIAHLVGDVANPMHTDSRPAEDSIHSPYETDVDQRSTRRGTTYRFNFDGLHKSEPRAKTVHVATVAHRAYENLVSSYSGGGYTSTVHRITKRQLNRGANAVADLAAGLKNASRQAASCDEADGGSGGGPDGGSGSGDNCDSAYPDVCIPSPPPDLNCDDVSHTNIRVVEHPDPHGFDGNNDGVGCET